MREIPLTQGKIAIIDDEDFERINKFKWHAWKNHTWSWYARRKGPASVIAMHRLIMDAPQGMEVDHINGDGLDNRRSNLRVCTRIDNSRNRAKPLNKTSIYKGVTWARGKWQVSIRVNYKHIYIGRFASEIDAAKAYDEAAKKYYGEFARINFVTI